MIFVAKVLTVLIALLHIWILILEMFLWTSSYGRKAFAMSLERALATKVLAANQGLYNGFLASGLLWGVYREDLGVQCFFLVCVLVAGLFGGLTVGRKILYIQALPALAALGLIFFRL